MRLPGAIILRKFIVFVRSLAALTSEPQEAIQDRERRVSDELRGELEEYDELIGHVSNLLHPVADAFKTLEAPTPVAKLQLLLLVRVLGDLRVCQWAASTGYAMQALTLAASIHELSYAIAYLKDSDERARKWIEHVNDARTYPECGHRNVISEVAKHLGLDEQETEQEYRIYRELCMAKHGNPLLQKHYGALERPGGVEVQQLPFYSPRTVWMCRFAMLHVARSVLVPFSVYVQLHLGGSPDALAGELDRVSTELRRLGDRDGLMKDWEEDSV